MSQIPLHLEKNFVMDMDDGFVYYWPDKNGGYYTSYQLRAIADELDRRNEKWESETNEYFKSETE